MSDIVERAEQRLSDAVWARNCKVEPGPFPELLLRELVAELKAARAEIAENREWIEELTTSDE